jgi:hypothetical protein
MLWMSLRAAETGSVRSTNEGHDTNRRKSTADAGGSGVDKLCRLAHCPSGVADLDVADAVVAGVFQVDQVAQRPGARRIAGD